MTAVVAAAGGPSWAASIHVQPALIDVAAPAQASLITLRNAGSKPVTVQIRVMAWSQSNGHEQLGPSEDVVASPPAALLAPGEDYVVRVVRVASRPVTAEESYRLLVDEIPDPSQLKAGTVRLLVRQSIPVFFGTAELSAPDLRWAVKLSNGRLTVAVRNAGGTRERISSLTLTDSKGHELSFGTGLVGYALVSSTMSWTVAAPRGFADRGTVSISATGAVGALDATAKISR